MSPAHTASKPTFLLYENTEGLLPPPPPPPVKEEESFFGDFLEALTPWRTLDAGLVAIGGSSEPESGDATMRDSCDASSSLRYIFR